MLRMTCPRGVKVSWPPHAEADDEALMLAPLDLAIIGSYLAIALAVGFWVRQRAESSREAYFLADRSLPWWWAGASIAATTFAADTPLAVTGIIASRGLSGNWMWLSWVAVHAGVVVYFASRWSRLGVVTDAEYISVRYEGRSAEALRLFRAGLYGLLYNAIILGWVLKAMVKIASPFFDWASWAPGWVSLLESFWPDSGGLGSPGEASTVLILLIIVAIYSSAGGLAGVVITDLVQLGLALVGSTYFAVQAYSAVGGSSGLRQSLDQLYGEGHFYLELFPRFEGGWMEAAGLGAFGFGLYLAVQSFANLPSDGGGYLMQRLNATKSPRDASKAALLFVALQYFFRVWPWFIVGLAALVLIPLGQEASVMNGLASSVSGDRESAYPILMQALLPSGMLGLMVASLLAAFMSTVDTHLNWGASYVVSDLLPKLRPDASERTRVRVARAAVVAYTVLALVVCFQIETIEVAWRWIAALGAALGPVTAIRWLWWRVTAWSELASAGVGLLVSVGLAVFSDLSYEMHLILTAASASLVLFVSVFIGPAADAQRAVSFAAQSEALGFWPDRSRAQGLCELGLRTLAVGATIGAVVLALALGHWLFFGLR